MKRAQGFTLLEMLVALTVSVLVAMAGASALNSTQQTMRTYNQVTDELRELRLALRTLRNDFEQLQRRPIRDEFGTTRTALYANQNESDRLAEFSTGGWRNPREFKRASIARVAYVLDGDKLKRLRWPVLDRVLADTPADKVILNGVEAIKFEFLTDAKLWVPIWPMTSPNGAANANNIDLPVAIRVTITLQEQGTLTRIFVGAY